MADRAVRIAACTCSRCGAELDGLDNDRIFTCRRCSIGFDVFTEPFRIHPIRFVEPVLREPAPLIYLPIWQFLIRAEIHGNDSSRLEKAKTVLPESLLVIAFKMHGWSVFGNLNLLYANRRVDLKYAEGVSRPLVGCRRTGLAAQSLVDYILLAAIDRTVDVTGLTLEIHTDQLLLLGYPYYELDSRLKDAVSGDEFRCIAVDDLAEIRAIEAGTSRD